MQLPGKDQASIFAAQPHCPATLLTDLCHDLFVDLANKDHLYHVHGRLIRNTQAIHELRVYPHFL